MNEMEKTLEALTKQAALPEIALGLDRVQMCLARLGHPERQLPPVVHIAGTNGKGSTLATLKAMCEAEGKRVHAYTSPHLVRFNERIVLAGQEIDDARLLAALRRVKAAGEIPLTFFEATTLAAFVAFAEVKADVLLLEVGLGGRLDATNVVEPVACVITPISEDHKEYLGETLAEIGQEKAGIIKPGTIVIVAEQQAVVRDVINARIQECGAEGWVYGDQWVLEGARVRVKEEWFELPKLALAGEHQRMNAATAFLTAYKALGMDPDSVLAAIGKTVWPARLQQLSHGPLVDVLKPGQALWLDGGHNPAAAEALANWVSAQKGKTGLIVGMMKRKDAQGFFRPWLGMGVPVATVAIEDGFLADVLAVQAAGMERVKAHANMEDALEWLQAEGCERFLVCGSLYLAGKLLGKHS